MTETLENSMKLGNKWAEWHAGSLLLFRSLCLIYKRLRSQNTEMGGKNAASERAVAGGKAREGNTIN